MDLASSALVVRWGPGFASASWRRFLGFDRSIASGTCLIIGLCFFCFWFLASLDYRYPTAAQTPPECYLVSHTAPLKYTITILEALKTQLETPSLTKTYITIYCDSRTRVRD